jgi:DNA-binding MarR family transcriptional regulator
MTHTPFSAVVRLIGTHALLEQRFTGELGAVHGLSLNDTLLMMHLEKASLSRLSRVDLAKRLCVSPSTVTRMTLPLEKLGLVGRQADARDARLAYVTLSDTGREVITAARATLERKATEVFRDRWAPEDIATLSDLLGRLTAGQSGDLG